MRGYLLDTHVLLWWLAEPGRLTPRVHELIAEESNAIFFSAAAAWEMSIKKALGRLDHPPNLADLLDAARIEILPVTLPHALAVAELPPHRGDPFDRMQIAQALVEQLAFVTADSKLFAYDVPIVRA